MIRFDWIITNGYVDQDTIWRRAQRGWNFVVTLPASMVDPHAMPTDKITLFSMYERTGRIDYSGID